MWLVVCLWRRFPCVEVLSGLVEAPSFAVLTYVVGLSIGGSAPSNLDERGKGSPLRRRHPDVWCGDRVRAEL